MIYVTYEDLCRDIRENLNKIPRDVCGVVGVPRSGMLPATIIAEYLNVPMFDLHSLVEIGHGGRPLKRTSGNKLLVVDDTCFHGNSLTVTKRTLREHGYDGFDFEFLVVYLEGPCDNDKPDIYLRDIRDMGICPVVHMVSDRITPAWKVKAEMYKEQRWILFIESSEWQARHIYEETGKPVFCVQTNELYG